MSGAAILHIEEGFRGHPNGAHKNGNTLGEKGGAVQRFYAILAQFGPGEWFSFVSVFVALIGACVSVFAARIKVQDNMDRFIADLTRQAKWNGIAASINVVAGALIFISVAITMLDKFRD